ncbi:MAG: alpha/beta hydrolase [Mariprofundaceae bacterium]
MIHADRQQPKIVLLCGMLGIRRVLWREYFHGVRKMLEKQGFSVLVPSLPFGQGVEKRSRFLAEFLRQESGPLHLIAHSMGGVDARFYISRLGGYRKVASLTTLASPHRGSTIADHEMATWYSLSRHFPAVAELTPHAMTEFNEHIPDCDDVVYRSYSAARDIHRQPWLTRHFGRLLEAAEGANDSQVSVASGIWGEHIATLNCDHFELIGMHIWLNPFAARKAFEHLPLYREIGDWIDDFEKNISAT